MLAAEIWQPVGPFSATGGQVENTTPSEEVVGAIHTVLADPNNADVLYIGATNGGVWKTSNATAMRPSWMPLTDQMPSSSIGALFADIADPAFQTIYAGTARYSNLDQLGGDRIGLMRTTDGGESWSVVDPGGTLRGKNISGLYANGDTIVVSVNTADTFNPNNVGIFRSTNAGASFDQVSIGDGSVTGLPAGVAYDLFNDPVDANVLYTSSVFSAGLGGGQVGVYKSVNQGESWTKISNSLMDALIDDGASNLSGTSNLEITVGNSDNVYVSIINAGHVDGIFHSGNGGISWSAMDTPSTSESGTDFGLNPGGTKGPPVGSTPEQIAGGADSVHFSIVADPNDPLVVYVGGDRQPALDESNPASGPTFPNSIGAMGFSGRLFRGDAGQPSGSQWVHLTHSSALGAAGGGTASSSAPHAGSREMVFDADGNLIEVDDGGIYRRSDPQTNVGDWVSLIGDLQITEPHHVAYDAVSDVVISGNQDTGTTQQPSTGATIWETVSTATGGAVVVDDVSLAGRGQSIRYSSFQDLGTFRARTYDASGALISEVFPNLQITSGAPLQSAPITPVELNSVDPNQLVFQGINGTYESLDQGNTLRQIPVAAGASSGNTGHDALVAGGVLNGLANDRLLWVASGSDLLGRTATNPVLTPVASSPPVADIVDLAVDSQDWNNVFVADRSAVAMSTDAGSSWTDITSDLMNKASTIWSLAFVDGPTVDTLLAGTNLGIFATAIDALGTWVPVGSELPNVPAFDLEFDLRDDVLVAGMLGRGSWLLDDARQSVEDTVLSGTAPTLLAVAPNSGELFDLDPQDQAAENLRAVSPTELVLTFGGEHALDPLTLDAISVQYSESGNFALDAVTVPIGFAGVDDSGRSVTLRFADNLADGFYQLAVTTELTTIFGAPFEPNFPEPDPSDAALMRDVISFELELGAKVTAVVVQPIVGGIEQSNAIDVYFDDIDLFRNGTSVTDPDFYQLIDTQSTVTTEDDVVVRPISPINIDTVNRKVTLTFGANLDTFSDAGDSLRLRIGDDSDFTAVPVVRHFVADTVATDPGLTFATANTIPVAVSGDWSTLIVGQAIDNTTGSVIGPAGTPIPIISMVDNPGGRDEPGHRDIEAIAQAGPQYHLLRGGDNDNEITVLSYSFMKDRPYGTDSRGQQLFTDLNQQQEDRFKEVLDIYSAELGIDFYEVESGQDLALIVGDLSTQDPTLISGPGGVVGVASSSRVTMDSSDFQTAQSNEFGGTFFTSVLREVGRALGLGYANDLPPGTIAANTNQYPDTDRTGPGTEWAFPGDHDIVHGIHLHQKESQDVDLYRIDVAEAGVLKAQTFAQRLPDASLLNTRLTLYRANGTDLELISANEDYFGSDSFIEFPVEAGIYVVGVASAGNTNFDPDSGLPSAGGTSEGVYQLRVDFTSESATGISDTDGSLLDGDRDGVAGGNYNLWFEPTRTNTIYVDKLGGTGSGALGSLTNPYTNIPAALVAAETAVNNGQQGVVVRLLPNGGADNDVTTAADNVAYEVGFVQALNRTLDDGRNLVLPGGVHLVVDAGVIVKFLDSRISVGSDDDGNDRSEGTISVRGTPGLPVSFTSFNDRVLGANSNPLPVSAAPGDWGGIEIRNDVDRLQGRKDAERIGVFQNYINHAEFHFGGGEVSTLNRSIDPIHLSQARAEVSYNFITTSADAAISADPNTFEFTTFTEPRFQASSISSSGFKTDYDRQGPVIHGNQITGNSTNGIFVRIDTPAGGELETLEVPARFDDTDIVHVLGENLLINGAAGGPIEDADRPDPILGATVNPGGALLADDYRYSYTFVDPFGFESPGSRPQSLTAVPAGSQINLTGIPVPRASSQYVARRLYRSVGGGPFRLIAELDKTSTDHTDSLPVASTSARILDATDGAVRHGRIDGSLIIDPGMIIKNQGARIQLGYGATLLAEGVDGNEIIFTARSDDRYGAGGTFDTNGNALSVGSPADWAGIYAAPTSRMSIDHALLAFAGGETGVNGGTAAFNPIQVHQAQARIANTLFEHNADGTSTSQGNARRDFAPNVAATIVVTAAQPTIIKNTFIDNAGAVVSINVNAMNADFITDQGRQTGSVDVFTAPPANQGPVIRGNRLAANDINGLDIRGEVLTTEVVWDDTDIVHVLRDDIEIPDLHTFGGMRLESSSTESLVVKADGAEILATGRALDITDRIGGRLFVLGQPGFPVVMTSLFDDTVGAGFAPDGSAQVDTETAQGTDAAPGDWQGLKLDAYSHDRNVAVATEREGVIGGFGDSNATIGDHEELGLLAANEKSGDENIRLGFTVHGAIAADLDQDMYSFSGVGGTMVWIDVDRTDPRLDTVLELIDGDGRVLALSQNSRTESANGRLTYTNTALLRDGHALPMKLDHDAPRNKVGDEYRDLYTTNDGDSAMRVVLPGSTGTRNTFYIRVRSSNAADDYTTIAGIDSSLTSGGQSHGGYQLQVRIQEIDEHAGSTIRYADLRYASSAIVAQGLPAHSPIAGELFNPGGTVDLGNFSNTDRGAVSVAGVIDSTPDTYTFDVDRDSVEGPPNTDYSQSIIVDVDWADGLTRPDTNAYLFDGDTLIAIGTDSNVADDQVTPIVPGQATTEKDLSRGSHGLRDPFIGPLELNPTGTYQVIVTTDEQMPADMAQFTQIDPPNTNARLEPIDSVVRVSDDRFDYRPGTGASDTPLPNRLEGPQSMQVAFNDDGSNIIPWQFGDVPLIALREDAHTIRQSARLSIYNPFTGRHDAIIEEFSALNGDSSAEIQVGAIAQSARGDVLALHNHGVDVQRDSNTSPVYSVSADGVFRRAGSTGIRTYRQNSGGNPTVFSNVTANVGYEFEALAYYNDTDTNTRFLYGVANRGDHATDGLPAGVFRGADVIHDMNGTNQIGGTSTVLDGHNMIFLLDPDTGAAISRRGQDMIAGFESANPLDPQLRDDFGGNPFFPPETPWAGSNIVAQLQVPTRSPATGANTGSVTSLVTDIDGGAFLYAFTDTGAVWRMAIQESTTGLYGPGDLRGTPTLIVDPTLPNAVAGTNFISDSDGNALIFDKVTHGPANFVDVNDTVGISDLYFGVTRGTARPEASFLLSNTSIQATGGVVSYGTGTLSMVARSGGVADGTEGDELTNITVTYGNANPSSTYNTGTNTLIVRVTTADGATSINDLVAAINAGNPLAGFTATAGTDPGVNQPAANLATLTTALSGGRDAGDAVISVRANTPGPASNGVTVTVQDSTVPPPNSVTATFDVSGNILVNIHGTVTYDDVRSAINSLAGYSASILSSSGDQNYIDTLDVPPPVTTLNGGANAGRRFYAFDFAGGNRFAQPIFEFGAESVRVDDNGSGDDFAGLFFSSLDQTLWHITDTLRTAPGHGMGALDDRATVIGGGSIRFGFDPLNDDFNHLSHLDQNGNSGIVSDNSDGNNDLDAVDLQGYQDGTMFQPFEGYNFLGGAHGAVQSNILDLSSFSADDLPTLYFTYLLDTENTNADASAGSFSASGLDDVMRDSLRVSVRGRGGIWQLVATNNMADDIDTRVWRDHRGSVHEYDPVGSNGYTSPERQRFVQELFDDDVFRQARIDLGPWAGQDEVQIRFEFSTAGEARPDQSEIHASPGEHISDGHQLTIAGEMPDPTVDDQGDTLINRTRNFEFDLGLVVQMPSGAHVAAAGGSITLARPDGSIIVELISGSPTSGTQVQVLSTDSVQEVADKVEASIGSTLRAPSDPSWVAFAGENTPGTYSFTGLDDFILGTPGVTAGQIRIPIDIAMSEVEVRDQIQLALATTIHYRDAAPSLAAFPVVGNTSAVRIYDLQVSQSASARRLTLIQGENANTSNMPGSEFGVYSGNTSVAGLLRAGERSRGLGGGHGVYIDDIVIGLADRGESFTGSTQGTAMVDNPYFEALIKDPATTGTRPVREEITVGEYQIEVRLGREYLGADNRLKATVLQLNDRLADGLNLRVESGGSELVDGDTFELSNGFETLTFEFNDATVPALTTATAPGNVAIDYRIFDTPAFVADHIRHAINSGSVRSVLGIQATSRSGLLYDASDPVILLHGYAAADNLGSSIFASPHLTGMITGGDANLGEDNGDSNLRRDQGVFIVDSNIVSFSSGAAIDVSAGPQQAGNKVPNEGDRPKPGAVQHLPSTSTEKLVHGAVVQNNLLISNGDGIVLRGDPNYDSTAADLTVPAVYSRILNNTIFNSNTGITVADGAAPTLLNNVLVDNSIGILGQNEGPTVIRATVYDGNGDEVSGVALGTEAIVDPVGPLFVNPSSASFDPSAGNPNFYPATGSALVDSSIQSQLDRSSIVAVKDSVGIPQSPILVSQRDLAGQLRENGSTSSGQGQNVNIDRGALDRSDTIGPQARLIVPTDNDADHVDIDRNDTVLQLTEGIFNFFEILITEDAGIGPDASTITPDQIIVYENGKQLIDGINVIIGYNHSNRTLRIQSPSGIWRPDGVYEIVMLNQLTLRTHGTLIRPVADLAGNSLQPNRADGQTRFTIVMPQVEIDFGDAPDSYRTQLTSDGARHAIINQATPRLGRYIDGELDTAGVDTDDLTAVVVADGNVGEGGDGPFRVIPGVPTTIELIATPQPFDNLAVTAGNRTLIFELVEEGGTAAANRVPVAYPAGASLGQIMDRLSSVMQSALLDQYVQAVVEHTPGTTELTLVGQDDEDGVGIGSFTDSGGTVVEGIFIDPATGDLLDYLNPSAVNGSELVIHTVGGGFVDGWVDFNGDGDFLDIGEQVVTSAPVHDGENRLRLNSPSSPLPTVLVSGTGFARARFRLNETGNQSPSGLQINGEVEDYVVFIANAPIPEPTDDSINVTEDTLEIGSVAGNDALAGAVGLSYIQQSDPSHGTLTWNEATGDFTYQPDEDFYGEDSFTYQINGTQVLNGITLPVSSSRVATVSLTVAPINDPPEALGSLLVTTEPTDTNPSPSITVTNADLLMGAVPHSQSDERMLVAPFDESEQRLRVVDIQVIDNSGVLNSVISAPDPLQPPDGIYRSTTHLADGVGGLLPTGTITVTVTSSEVVSVMYQPADDYNQDNPGTASSLPSLDQFVFTVADDGATALPTQLAAETASATVFIRVLPQNDPPIASDDAIVGIPEDPDPLVGFPIPIATLLANDSAAPAAAQDENGLVNDSAVSLITGVLPTGLQAFPLTTAQGGTVRWKASSNELIYQPPADFYGADSFVYFIQDQGLDFSNDPASGPTATLNSKVASATVFLTVDPVNDVPLAPDQSFTTMEDTPMANRPAAELLVGSRGDADPRQSPPLDESDQTTAVTELRVNGTVINQSNFDSAGPFLTRTGGEIQAVFSAGFLKNWSYIPAADFNRDHPTNGGPETFEFTVQDNGVPPAAAVATASIVVYPRNDTPVPSPDLIDATSRPAAPAEDTTLIIPAAFLLSNDLNAPATALDETGFINDVPLSIVRQPDITTTLGGSVTFMPSGDLLYTPPKDQSGLDSFTYSVADNGTQEDSLGAQRRESLTASTQVSIVVEPVNDDPMLDPIQAVNILEDTPLHVVELTGIDAGGGESQELRVTALSSNTALLPHPIVLYTSNDSVGTLALIPGADQSGVTTVSVTVEDAGLDGVIDDVAGTTIDESADNLSVTRTFLVRVNAVNDAPVLEALNDVTIAEDSARRVVQLSGIDAGGGESQPLRVTASSDNPILVADPVVSYSSPDSSGTISLAPRPDSFGTATITVTVEDGGLDRDLATASDNLRTSRDFVLTVDPLNDPPTVAPLIDHVITEDAQQQTVALTAISAGPDESQNLKVTASSDNPGLISDPSVDYASPSGSGTLTYTPNADQFGVATITVSVEDGGDDDDLSTFADNLVFDRTFTVTVEPVNDDPSINSLSDISILEDSPPQIIPLTGIDAGGGESQPLQVMATSDNPGLIPDPLVNYTSPNSFGSLVLAPDANQSGTATITVTVVDPGLDGVFSTVADNAISSQTFVVSVTPVNDPPTLDVIQDQSATEDSETQSITLTGITAGGAENQPLRIIATSGDPTLVSDLVVTYANPASIGRLSYTPQPNQFGSTAVTVTIEDGGADRNLDSPEDNATLTRTFQVTIEPVNDPPVLDRLPDLEIDEDSGQQSLSLTGISAGPGETQSLRVVATSDTPSLILDPVVNYDSGDASGSLTFTPQADQFGTATITVTVEDSGLDGDFSNSEDNLSFSQSFTIQVNNLSDPPVPQDDTLATDEDIVLRINDSALLANDRDPDLGPGSPERLSILMPPRSTSALGATITYNATTGRTTYDPSTSVQLQALGPGQSLQDSFVYQVIDLDGELNPPRATVFLDVTGINDAPTAADDAVTAPPSSTSVVIQPLANDFDVDGTLDLDSAVITRAPRFGALAKRINADGVLELAYSPFGNFVTDDFSYAISDNLGQSSAQATVTLTPSMAPITVADAVAGRASDDVNIDVLSNDTVLPGQGSLDPASLSIVAVPSHGQADPQPDGTVSYRPHLGFVGTDSFQYTIADSSGNVSVPTNVSVTIQGPPPATGIDVAGGVARDSLNIDVLSNDVPLHGQLDLATVTIVGEPSNGQALPQPDGTITYIADAGYFGFDSFQYTIADSLGSVSPPTTVLLRTVESGLENPLVFGDVNADGQATVLDALIVINRLAASGESIVTVRPEERGPNFVDVNGNMEVSALDALQVINHIAEQVPLLSAEQEPIPIIADMASSVGKTHEWQPAAMPLDHPDLQSGNPNKPPNVEHDNWVDPALVDLLAKAQDSDRTDEGEDAVSTLNDLALLDL